MKRIFEQKFLQPIKISLIAVMRLIQEKHTYQAAALAFTTLLALVPLLSTAISFIAIFPFFTKIINLTRNYILQNLIPASGNIIQSYLDNFVQQTSHLPKFSFIFLFFTTAMLIITIKHTLNDIWETKQIHKKLIASLFYWLAIIITPFFIGLTVFVGSYLFSLPAFSDFASRFGLTLPLLAVLTLVINTIVLTILYFVTSNNLSRWRDALLGGLIAALLFDIAKYGFTYYVRYFPTYELIYGTLAIIPLFLVWLYISWLVILYGAMVAHTSYTLRT